VTAVVLLEVNGLSIRFDGLVAIEDLSLEVRVGEVLSLIGPNGAGKTTAFNAITGYLAPSAGEILFRGARLNGLKPNRIAELGLVRTFRKRVSSAGAARWRTPVLAQPPPPAPSVARENWRRKREIRVVGLAARVGSWAPFMSSACSKSRSRLPQDRSSCCWTSRCPA
jgi:branched-chain amino acid transport system ATP-binding protein